MPEFQTSNVDFKFKKWNNTVLFRPKSVTNNTIMSNAIVKFLKYYHNYFDFSKLEFIEVDEFWKHEL